MKKIHNKWFKGGLIALLAISGMASCSDDHFDVKDTTSSASTTLWENIVASHQLDSFAMILEKTIVNKKEYGTPSTITYKQLLQSARVSTVWAPKDGTYNAKKWLDLLATGEFDNHEIVEMQFVKNHIADFNYNGSYPEEVKMRLNNSKYVKFNPVTGTYNDIEIAGASIPASNGTLYLLQGESPYEMNLYEILSSDPRLASMYAYIKSNDTLRFVEWLSLEGAVVDGQIQYVDSVFIKSNKIFTSGNSTNEDSTTVAIYPSNAAWTAAYDHIKDFYKYHENAAYGYYNDNAVWVLDSTSYDVDSIADANTVSAVFNNMFYSLTTQPNFDIKSLYSDYMSNILKPADERVQIVKRYMETTDSIVSTQYYGRSDAKYKQHGEYARAISEGKTPIAGSNGYAFITDNFNFVANQAWAYDIETEGEHSSVNLNYCRYLSNGYPSGANMYVTSTTRNEDVPGTLSGDAYRKFYASSASAQPQVGFNLNNVLSATYDIYVVIVPENIADASNTNPKKNKFTTLLIPDFDVDGKPTEEIAGDKTFESDPSKIDTILLYENFKFPYCYKGIQNSAPLLQLKVVMGIADRKTVTPELNIDCIILKNKDE